MEKIFRIRLDSPSQTFSSAHFIMLDGNHCEGLHGHNFRCTVELEQPLENTGLVLDFVQLSNCLDGILKKLDSKTLLQGENPRFKFTMTEKEPEESPGTLDWMNKMGGWLSSVNVYSDSEKELTSDDYFQKMVEMMEKSSEEQVFKGDFPDENVSESRAFESVSDEMKPMEVELEVRFGTKRWVFPLEECEILPIFNTTAEQLAEYVAGQLEQSSLLANGAWSRLCVEIEEAPGMKGICELRNCQKKESEMKFQGNAD